MRNVKKLLGLGAVAATVTLSGCAPGMFAFRQCGGIQAYSPTARITSVNRATQQVAAVQSRYMLANNRYLKTTESWKQLASGECRY